MKRIVLSSVLALSVGCAPTAADFDDSTSSVRPTRGDQSGNDAPMDGNSVFDANNNVGTDLHTGETMQRRLPASYRLARAAELRAYMNASDGSVRRAARPIAASVDKSMKRSMRAAAMAMTEMRFLAEQARRGAKGQSCVHYRDLARRTRSAEDRAFEVRFDDCSVSADGATRLDGRARLAWNRQHMLFEMLEATLMSDRYSVNFEGELRWEGRDAPIMRFSIAKDMNDKSVRDDDAFGYSIDRMMIYTRGERGAREFVIEVPRHAGQMFWARAPERHFDFDMRMSFVDAPNAAPFSALRIGGRFEEATADGSVTIPRFDLHMMADGSYEGVADLAVEQGTTRIATNPGMPGAVRFAGHGSEVTMQASLLMDIEHRGASRAGHVMFHDIVMDLATPSLPNEGAVELAYTANGTAHAMMMYFQDNSSSDKWVRVQHREVYEANGQRVGKDTWFCVRLDGVPIPQPIASANPSQHYCE